MDAGILLSAEWRRAARPSDARFCCLGDCGRLATHYASVSLEGFITDHVFLSICHYHALVIENVKATVSIRDELDTDDEGRPEVPSVRKGERLLLICPACGHVHRHGGEGGSWAYSYRTEHCSDESSLRVEGGYVLVPGDRYEGEDWAPWFWQSSEALLRRVEEMDRAQRQADVA
jgi:hypothetical protein